MAKVVYNACFGGFSLSRKAILRAREISRNRFWGGACIKGDVYDDGSGICQTNYGHIHNVPRHDLALVQVIEELGDDANGAHAKLKLEALPDGSKYRIDEYDGNESVETPDSYQWVIAA